MSNLPHQAQQQQRSSFLVGEPNTLHMVSRRLTQSQLNEQWQQYLQERTLFWQGTEVEAIAAELFSSMKTQCYAPPEPQNSSTPVLMDQFMPEGLASPYPQQHPTFSHSAGNLHPIGGRDASPFDHPVRIATGSVASQHVTPAVDGATAMLPPQSETWSTNIQQLENNDNLTRRMNNQMLKPSFDKKQDVLNKKYDLKLKHQKDAINTRLTALRMRLRMCPDDRTTLLDICSQECKIMEVELQQAFRRAGLNAPEKQQKRQHAS